MRVAFTAFAMLSARRIGAFAPCSGHGMQYPEDVALGLPAACECYQCYGGSTCTELMDNCTVDVTTVELTAFGAWFGAKPNETSCSLTPLYHQEYLAAHGCCIGPASAHMD